MNLKWKTLLFDGWYKGSYKDYRETIPCPNRITNIKLADLIQSKLGEYEQKGIDIDNVIVSYDIYDDTNTEVVVTDADRLYDYLDLRQTMLDAVNHAYCVAENAYEEGLDTGYWNGPGFYDAYFM